MRRDVYVQVPDEASELITVYHRHTNKPTTGRSIGSHLVPFTYMVLEICVRRLRWSHWRWEIGFRNYPAVLDWFAFGESGTTFGIYKKKQFLKAFFYSYKPCWITVLRPTFSHAKEVNSNPGSHLCIFSKSCAILYFQFATSLTLLETDMKKPTQICDTTHWSVSSFQSPISPVWEPRPEPSLSEGRPVLSGGTFTYVNGDYFLLIRLCYKTLQMSSLHHRR